ncbi:LacI family DNA-binding transcriptional regulator [Rhodococcus sp. T2V]|uniref:LacI family DNA-binding transcriptional regulator n=1 Tax=Rhodococcus sp. T2V TaxID=3034164 RepID=UPI0023E1EB6B|nr:LacI family DNA-binding transcriptional regulator [Rhodococcus sp. T2V]MDF3311162.1 LacI family DNA-binding transcriptional regulator [Rhodococcus sp. T2V]
MREPTLRDVADAAGVHTGTASRALNPEKRYQVNAETVRRVLKAAQSLGYTPNPIARSLKTARSRTVGVIIPDLTNPLFPPIVRGIDEVLGSHGYSAWIVSTDNDPEREKRLVESLRSRQVEGLIIATAQLEHPLLSTLHQKGVKVVLVNRGVEKLEIPSVTPDDAAGVILAVDHLAELGHTRIAHIGGPQTTSTGTSRARAYRHAIRDRRLDDDPSLLIECSDWKERDGAAALRSLLDRNVKFTAIVAGNDLLALGCYDVFAERGIQCPDDISVVGFNDMPFLDKFRPPMTSVRVPQFDVGVEAGRMLLDLLKEPNRHPRSILLPVSLVVRGSTATAPR